MKRSIASLDGLRAVSITLVMLGHLYGTKNYPATVVTYFAAGFAHLGVQVFFVISGFLITRLLMQERAATGTVDLTAFYIRRTLRIVPASFAYITVIALTAHPGYLAYAFTYTMCYAPQARPWLLGHLWSLSVEEQFYLIWPVMFVLGFKYRVKLGIAVLILAIAARLIFWLAGMRSIDEYFPAVADSLIAGCLLALLQHRLRTRFAKLMKPTIFWGLGLLVLAAPHLLNRVRLQIFLGGLVPLVIALFVFAAVERKDWFLNNRFSTKLGILSYSLYLWQQPFLNRGSTHWWTAFPANALLALLCATASFMLVENRLLEAYKRFKTDKGTTGTPLRSSS